MEKVELLSGQVVPSVEQVWGYWRDITWRCWFFINVEENQWPGHNWPGHLLQEAVILLLPNIYEIAQRLHDIKSSLKLWRLIVCCSTATSHKWFCDYLCYEGQFSSKLIYCVLFWQVKFIWDRSYVGRTLLAVLCDVRSKVPGLAAWSAS